MPTQPTAGPSGELCDFDRMTLADVRSAYLATSTTAMPIGGLIAWAGLASAMLWLGEALPHTAPFYVAALPFPLALLIDRVRGRPGISSDDRHNPVTRLFMQFIFVVALLIPFVIIAAGGNTDLLVLGLAVFAGLVWVPHGWGADDPAGMRHFAMRTVLCYAAYLFAPDVLRGAAVAGMAALTYVYAIAAMRKPTSAVR